MIRSTANGFMQTCLSSRWTGSTRFLPVRKNSLEFWKHVCISKPEAPDWWLYDQVRHRAWNAWNHNNVKLIAAWIQAAALWGWLMTVHVSKSECRHSGRTLRKPCRLVGRKTVGQRNELRCVHGTPYLVSDRHSCFWQLNNKKIAVSVQPVSKEISHHRLKLYT